MKIGIITDAIDIQPAGIGVYVENLVRSLLSIDKENDYFLIHNEPSSHSLYRDQRINEVRYTNWGRHIPHVIQDSMFLTTTKLKFDVVHKPTPTAFLFPFRARKIITIHDLAAFAVPEIARNYYRYCYKQLLLYSTRVADQIITVSESTKQDVIKFLAVNPQKITTIYEGVEPKFKVILDNIYLQRVKHKYNLPEHFILHVGTFEPRKNLGDLLDSYNRLKLQQKIPHRLVLVGKLGWQYQAILNKIKQLNCTDSILLLDYIPREDLPGLYNLATALVYPSSYEGFGLPLLEAMACGCPVITYFNSSIPEVVGNAGFMVKRNDGEDLATSIAQVITDRRLRSNLIKKGLERAAEFNWHTTALKTLHVYQ